MVLFFQTTAAAGGSGVLGDKHWMAAHGCLATVAAGYGGRQSFLQKLPPMIQNDRQALFDQIGFFFHT